MNPIWNLLLLFTAYSFIGWLGESIYCSVPAGKFVNRGFLNGPFCPIYGFGALLAVCILSPLQKNLPALFLAGVLLTSLLEYLTGAALELLFHAKYWDYSDQKCNLQGRVCLKNSLIFGLGSVVTLRLLQPALLYCMNRIPSPAKTVFCCFLLLYFTVDTVLTVNAIIRLNGKLGELQQVLDEIAERAHSATADTVEALQNTIAVHLDDSAKLRLKALNDSRERIESGFHAIQRRLIRAFPTMKTLHSNESLLHMREVIQNRAKIIRKK